MSAWWNFRPQRLDTRGGNSNKKKRIYFNLYLFEVQSETSWFYSLQLFSVRIQLTYPGIRFILQQSVNVNIWMASCLHIIHCGNLVQMAKSCKVTVDGPDRRYFIPQLAELRVPHWAMLTSHCGCSVVRVPGAHNNKYRSHLWSEKLPVRGPCPPGVTRLHRMAVSPYDV